MIHKFNMQSKKNYLGMSADFWLTTADKTNNKYNTLIAATYFERLALKNHEHKSLDLSINATINALNN